MTYLCDSGCEIDGVKFWGSPFTPWFHDWAFNRTHDIGRHWDLVPDSTDVLVTHGPPYGICDLLAHPDAGQDPHVGCPLLLKTIERVRPRAHVFGHIHEARGMREHAPGRFCVNASSIGLDYRPRGHSIVMCV